MGCTLRLINNYNYIYISYLINIFFSVPPSKNNPFFTMPSKHPSPATFDNFEMRISKFPAFPISKTRPLYLSSYSVYATSTKDRRNDDPLCTDAHVVMRVMRSKGIAIKGVTSARRKKGKPIADLLYPDTHETSDILYIGKASYFTGLKSSGWRLLATDFATTVPPPKCIIDSTGLSGRRGAL